MVDFISLLFGVAAGAVAAGVATYLIVKSSEGGKVKEAKEILDLRSGFKRKTIGKAELEHARRELRTVLLEKELLSSALTRLYEAEAEGRITRQEREQLSQKYRDQIKDVEAKLGDTELLIEVGELEDLREELINLFERKMSQLDNRLDQARVRLQQIRTIPLKTLEPIERVEKVKEVKKTERRRARAEGTELDQRVKALKDEVLEALARLEQIDVEG